MAPGSEVTTTESKAPSSLSAGWAFSAALRGARPRSERISQRSEKRPSQERPRSFQKRDHNWQGGGRGQRRKHVDRVPAPYVAAGATRGPGRGGGTSACAQAGTSGARTPPPRPRKRKWARGALTLGTKSNLDLEPGEEWRRVTGGGGSGWAGEPRERGRSAQLGMGLGGPGLCKGGQEGGALPGWGLGERGTRTSRIPYPRLCPRPSGSRLSPAARSTRPSAASGVAAGLRSAARQLAFSFRNRITRLSSSSPWGGRLLLPS